MVILEIRLSPDSSALANMREAIESHIELMREGGMPGTSSTDPRKLRRGGSLKGVCGNIFIVECEPGVFIHRLGNVVSRDLFRHATSAPAPR